MAFALLNGGEDTPHKAVNGNVTSLLPNAQQVGWIAGALARSYDQERHGGLHWRHGTGYHPGQV